MSDIIKHITDPSGHTPSSGLLYLKQVLTLYVTTGNPPNFIHISGDIYRIDSEIICINPYPYMKQLEQYAKKVVYDSSLFTIHSRNVHGSPFLCADSITAKTQPKDFAEHLYLNKQLIELIKLRYDESYNINNIGIDYNTQGITRREFYSLEQLDPEMHTMTKIDENKYGSDCVFGMSFFFMNPSAYVTYKISPSVAGKADPEIEALYPQFQLEDLKHPSTMSCGLRILFSYAKSKKISFPIKSIVPDTTVEFTTDQLSHIATELKINVTFNEYDINCCCILVHDNHAYKIKGLKKELKIQSEAEDICYLFFDFETVNDSDSNAIPYAFTFCTIFNLKYDCRAYKTGDFRKIDIRRDLYIDTCIGYGHDSLKTFREFLYYFNRLHKIKFYCVSFNGAKFDNFLLVKYFDKPDASKSAINRLFVTSNQFRSMFIHNNEFQDILYQLSPDSLANHTKNFNCLPRKSTDIISHEQIQQEYETNENFLDYVANHKLLCSYMYADCLSLASLAYCFTKSTNDAFQTSIPYHQFEKTIGSIVFKRAPKRPFTITEELDKICRENLVGGRTQLFKIDPKHASMYGIQGTDRLYSNKPFVSLDFVSLYPTVMCTGFYPCDMAEIMTLEEFHTEKPDCYILCAHIDQSNLQHKLIAMRTEENLDWHQDIIPEKYITNVEYKALLKYACKVTILDKPIYTFVKDDALFKEFIAELYKIKAREDHYKETKDPRYNPSLRSITKILLNALSGKYAQRNFKSITEIITDNVDKFLASCKWGTIKINEISNLISTITGDKNVTFTEHSKPSYVSMFIYANARMLHYETLINPKIENYCPVYCDTDSVYLPEPCYQMLVAKFGKKLFVEDSEHLKLTEKYRAEKREPTETMLLYHDDFYTADKLSIKKELGQIQLEHYISECWYYNAKDYAYISDNVLEIKLKGIHIKKYDEIPLIVYHTKESTNQKSYPNSLILTKEQKATRVQLNDQNFGYIDKTLKVHKTANGYQEIVHDVLLESCHKSVVLMGEDINESILHYDAISYDDDKKYSGQLYENHQYYNVTFSAYRLDPCALSIRPIKGTKQSVTKEEYCEIIKSARAFKFCDDILYFVPGSNTGYFCRNEEYFSGKYILEHKAINNDLLNARLKKKPINFLSTQFKKKWVNSSITIVQLYKALN